MRNSSAEGVSSILLQTERLRLLSYRAIDAHRLLAFHERNREHLAPWEPTRDDTFYTLAQQQAQIDTSIASQESASDIRFAAFEEHDGPIVACVNLWNIRRGVIHAAILGDSVDVSHQGRGFATETAKALLRTLSIHLICTASKRAIIRQTSAAVECSAKSASRSKAMRGTISL